MFRNDTQIIKIDGNDQFVDIRALFNGKSKGNKSYDKINFQFRKYDKRKEKGSRTSLEVDCFMDINVFRRFCHILKDYRINRLLEREKHLNEEYQKNNETDRYGKIRKAPPAFIVYGGSPDANPVISRIIRIEQGSACPVILKGINLPGIVSRSRAVQPDYKRMKEAKTISIGLTNEQCDIIGLTGDAAIATYDRWTADGIMDEMWERIRYKGSQARVIVPEKEERLYEGSSIYTGPDPISSYQEGFIDFGSF